MPFHNVIFQDQDFLGYNAVLNFFEDRKRILQVSVRNGAFNKIKFDIINEFIDTLDNGANLYGLFTRYPNEVEWTLRYVGQRKTKEIKQRLYQHLVKKHIETGSKLDYINLELQSGKDIGIKLLSVVPDELRHYYEEKLLQDISTDWNKQR